VSPKVVLVGLPGAGKTTTGRRLAKILVVPFADTDQLVEEREGATVAELFERAGEGGYRRLEAEVVSAALTGFDGVLSLGGGALTTASTREALVASGIPVAFLRTTLEVLGRRVGEAAGRPLLAGDPAARLADLHAERSPVYTAHATLTVDTDGRTPGQVAATIAARLHEREASR
jgi:shikimate kinase